MAAAWYKSAMPVGADEAIARAKTTALQGGRANDALLAVADGGTPLKPAIGIADAAEYVFDSGEFHSRLRPLNCGA